MRRKTHTSEYGRIQLIRMEETDTVTLLIENVNREGEHWLTLASLETANIPLGFIRLSPLTGSRHIFEVTEVRPATGSLLRSPGGSLDHEALGPEDFLGQGEDAA